MLSGRRTEGRPLAYPERPMRDFSPVTGASVRASPSLAASYQAGTECPQ